MVSHSAVRQVRLFPCNIVIYESSGCQLHKSENIKPGCTQPFFNYVKTNKEKRKKSTLDMVLSLQFVGEAWIVICLLATFYSVARKTAFLFMLSSHNTVF